MYVLYKSAYNNIDYYLPYRVKAAYSKYIVKSNSVYYKRGLLYLYQVK